MPRCLLLSLLLCAALPARAQVLHADGPLPSFDVISIKPAGQGRSIVIQPIGAIQVVTMIPFKTRFIINRAFGAMHMYGHNQTLIFGGPEWLDGPGYAIQVKIPDDIFTAMQKQSPQENEKEFDLMLQSMLAERYKLKVHFETREMPVYELVVGKDGLKIAKETFTRTSPGNMDFPMVRGVVVHVSVHGLTMAEFARSMESSLTDRIVVDKTGAEGTFTFQMDMSPEGTWRDNGAAPIVSDAPSLVTAIQDLGLKLVPAKAPMEVVVIDSIERPTAN